jgi:hypothetical protein
MKMTLCYSVNISITTKIIQLWKFVIILILTTKIEGADIRECGSSDDDNNLDFFQVNTLFPQCSLIEYLNCSNNIIVQLTSSNNLGNSTNLCKCRLWFLWWMAVQYFFSLEFWMFASFLLHQLPWTLVTMICYLDGFFLQISLSCQNYISKL